MDLLEFIELDDRENCLEITGTFPLFIKLENGTVCSLDWTWREVWWDRRRRQSKYANIRPYKVWNGQYQVEVTKIKTKYTYTIPAIHDAQPRIAKVAGFRDFLDSAYGDLDRESFEILKRLSGQSISPAWIDVLDRRNRK